MAEGLPIQDVKEEDKEAKSAAAKSNSLYQEWKAMMDHCSAEAQQRYAMELQHEEDRRHEAAAMRLPLRILQRRMIVFLIGWHASYCAARQWSPWLMALINAACLGGVHRLRAAPHGWHAFYSAIALSCLHVATTWKVPPLWMVFAAGLLVEMCVDIDRCCERYAWRQECKRLASLKRCDDAAL
jgi:hypothetical protein